MQENVGLAEVNGFNRIEITSTDRHSFLKRMFCGAGAWRFGEVGLGCLLNHHGMTKDEATAATAIARSHYHPGFERIRGRASAKQQNARDNPRAFSFR